VPIGNRREPALLLLDDGTRYDGWALGASGIGVGEVCFNTSLTGYQEILTDPSYDHQIVTMTYPEQGNYGTNGEDNESRRVFATGFVSREISPIASNFRATGTLEDFLLDRGVVGITGVDTRALTRHLRTNGSRPGVIISPYHGPADEARGRSALAAFGGLNGLDLATGVSTTEPYRWHTGVPGAPTVPARFQVIAYDYGIKHNILRQLVSAGCEVEVVPVSTPAAAILERRPDGVFLSNGPGDPAAVTQAIADVRALIGRVPLFGICLGHQIAALALGARTFKMTFGHRGGNQPVIDLRTGHVAITSQNHGFSVDADSLPSGAAVTHTNLNDKTVEGFAYPAKRLFTVQYHPEASPGPHDAEGHFAEFARLMAAGL
jgi:carbamoyl-phosphate synthase small subunit